MNGHNPNTPVPEILWLARVREFENCTYNPNVPGGSGFCTCPVDSGDGHRVAHCWKTDSAYLEHGYILHEVEPNDVRALQKPSKTGSQHV